MELRMSVRAGWQPTSSSLEVWALQQAQGCVRHQPLLGRPARRARHAPEEAVQGAGLAVPDDGGAQVDESAGGVHHL